MMKFYRIQFCKRIFPSFANEIGNSKIQRIKNSFFFRRRRRRRRCCCCGGRLCRVRFSFVGSISQNRRAAYNYILNFWIHSVSLKIDQLHNTTISNTHPHRADHNWKLKRETGRRRHRSGEMVFSALFSFCFIVSFFIRNDKFSTWMWIDVLCCV